MKKQKLTVFILSTIPGNIFSDRSIRKGLIITNFQWEGMSKFFTAHLLEGFINLRGDDLSKTQRVRKKKKECTD